MNLQAAIISQLQDIDLEIKSRKDKKVAKINAEAILDNLCQIVSNNKSDAYIVRNKEKVAMVLKMAQDKINAI